MDPRWGTAGMSEFTEFEPLLPAEKMLLGANFQHSFAKTVPDENADTGQATLRAEFVRAAILRDVGEKQPSEFMIEGARLTGDLKLDGVDIDQRILLHACLIEGNVVFDHSSLRFVSLMGCRLKSFKARGVILRHDLVLRKLHAESMDLRGARVGGDVSCNGVVARQPSGVVFNAESARIDGSLFFDDASFDGHVRLSLAVIGSTFQAPGATFRNAGERAITAERITVGGPVYFSAGFFAQGGVSIDGAVIKGDFSCSAGKFSNPGKIALNASGAEIAGAVFLGRGFFADGEVTLLGARITGQLNCSGGKYQNLAGPESHEFGRVALTADSVEVRSSVFLGEGFCAQGCVLFTNAILRGDFDCGKGHFSNPGKAALGFRRAVLDGSLRLQDGLFAGDVILATAKIGNLSDDQNSWPTQGSLNIDGLIYERLASNSPTTAEARLAWIDRQSDAHKGNSFRPQPWEHLIKVLREMGHPKEARQIAIAKQEALRKAGKVSAWPLHWVYGILAGYGYRPVRLIWIAVVLWGLCASLYSLGDARGAIGPSKREALQEFLNCQKSPQACSQPLRPFNPLMYSLDLILPVINLQQREEWSPIDRDWVVCGVAWPLGRILRIVMWFEIMFGWVASGVLIAMLSGLARKD